MQTIKMANEVANAPNKTWELSLYELHRPPQEAITDNTEIAVSPRSLHSELMCPICLDMLKNTMTTKECLHRFCQDCIITALRSGNKECPTCRKKLVSKRSLRPDPNFDSLISKIYPSRDEYEAHQERVLAKLNKHTSPYALSSSIEEGLRIQAIHRAQRVRKQPVDDGHLRPEGGVTSNENTPQKRPKSSSDDSSHEGDEENENLPNSRGNSVCGVSRPNSVGAISRANSIGGSSRPNSVAGNSILNSLGDNSVDENSNDASSEVTEPSSLPEAPSEPVNDIELVFKPHPRDAEGNIASQIRFIKTTANATG